MKIVVWSDAHMWPLTWKRFPQIRSDSEVAAQEVFEYARAHGLPIVFAGDLFDHGESGEVSRELALFESYRQQHPFFYVVGNHEDSGWFTAGEPNDAWLSVLEAQNTGLYGLHGTVAQMEALTVGGLNYQRGPDFGPALEAYKAQLAESGQQLDIFVCHQALKEMLSFEGAYQAECAQLVGIAPIVIVGDVHVPRVWEVEGTTFVSPGSTAVNNWGELAFDGGVSRPETRGFFVLEIEKEAGQPAKLVGSERVALQRQRTFLDLNALTPEDESNALALLQVQSSPRGHHEIRPVLARVRYNAESTTFRAELERLASPEDLVLDLVPVMRTVEMPKELETLRTDDGPVAAQQVVERHVEGDPQLQAVLVEILEDPAGRPDKILDRVVAEIVAGTEGGEA